MKQYTTERKPPIDFTIDGEPFQATGTPPADVLMGMSEIGKGEGASSLIVVKNLFDMVFDEENLGRFLGRMKSRTNPITFPTAMEIFNDLIVEYTGRPTELPSGSPDGQPGTATTSTAPAPSVA